MRLKYKNGMDTLSIWTDNASSSIKTAIGFRKVVAVAFREQPLLQKLDHLENFNEREDCAIE